MPLKEYGLPVTVAESISASVAEGVLVASPGKVDGMEVSTSSNAWVRIHDAATAGTISAANLKWEGRITAAGGSQTGPRNFKVKTGIAYQISGAAGFDDATAVTAEVNINAVLRRTPV